MRIASVLADQLNGTREWTLKLVADINGDDWKFQPAPGMSHALWLCGHIAVSQNTLVHVRCLRKPVMTDDFINHFPIGAPVKSFGEYPFPSPEAVLAEMKRVHELTLAAIRGLSDVQLAEPAYAADGKSAHPHYHDKAGAIAHCNRHEAFHAGQLATIRRLLGKAFLR